MDTLKFIVAKHYYNDFDNDEWRYALDDVKDVFATTERSGLVRASEYGNKNPDNIDVIVPLDEIVDNWDDCGKGRAYESRSELLRFLADVEPSRLKYAVSQFSKLLKEIENNNKWKDYFDSSNVIHVCQALNILTKDTWETWGATGHSQGDEVSVVYKVSNGRDKVVDDSCATNSQVRYWCDLIMGCYSTWKTIDKDDECWYTVVDGEEVENVIDVPKGYNVLKIDHEDTMCVRDFEVDNLDFLKDIDSRFYSCIDIGDNRISDFSMIDGHVKVRSAFRNNYISNGWISADGMVGKIISQKGNLYKIENYSAGKNWRDIDTGYWTRETCYVVCNGHGIGSLWAHGYTAEDARRSLEKKIENSKTWEERMKEFLHLRLDSVLGFEECKDMYRKITGACEFGTNDFAKTQEVREYSVSEVLEKTKGRYGWDRYKNYCERIAG
jgi:hypothetical protein